ncbi:hypothetical protein CALVIDRAFT_486045, partial [Calocera viscosa TUFC12733]
MQEPTRTRVTRRGASARIPAGTLEVVILINGHRGVALIDTGSTVDLVGSAFADVHRQLPKDTLEEPIPLQLAVSGSRSTINYSSTVNFGVAEITGKRRFEISNVDAWDVILGALFLIDYGAVI